MKRYVIRSKVRFLISISLIIIFSVSSFFTLVVSAKGNQDILMVPKYVEEGDTLWGMSQNHAGDMDIRDYILEVMDVNNLSSANIKPGELLYFPSYK